MKLPSITDIHVMLLTAFGLILVMVVMTPKSDPKISAAHEAAEEQCELEKRVCIAQHTMEIGHE